MLLTILMSCGVAIMFAIGGIFMKLSQDLSKPLYSAIVFGCFIFGAIVQTIVIDRTNLGGAYISILGLEAVVTLFLSIYSFKENFSFVKGLGLIAIVIGIACLRSNNI
jgi:multidrug transporter EmrE-like cation transporter